MQNIEKVNTSRTSTKNSMQISLIKRPNVPMVFLFSKLFVHKLYQYYQIATVFLYCALLARWIILQPLVGSKFLPGGIHEFLIYLLGISSIIELFWQVLFHGILNGLLARTALKDFNFLYFVGVMHFYDDYEHALVLKNTSYSSFIISVGFTQAYCHWHKLFKGGRFVSKRSNFWKINSYVMLPLMYTSEFYLLLLNVQNPNFHSTPLLDKTNRVILVSFFPIAITAYKKYLSRGV